MLDWLLNRSGLASGGLAAVPPVAAGRGGLLSGTHVASSLGWRPVEALAAGDEVLTFDRGLQPLAEVRRETLLDTAEERSPERCPLFVPRNVLRNRVPVWVMPDQGILLESDLVEDALGDPFAVVPAAALEGFRGIRRARPEGRLEMIALRFEADEVIYIEAGFLGFSPALASLLEPGVAAAPELYRVLAPGPARDLVLRMSAGTGGKRARPAIWRPAATGGMSRARL